MNRRDILKGIAATAPFVAVGVPIPRRPMVVTELVIDTRGAISGAAEYESAMRMAQSAMFRACDLRLISTAKIQRSAA